MLPRLAITADGSALPVAAYRGLTEVRVQQRLSLPALCELVFADPMGFLDIAARLAPGARLSVAAGDHAVLLFAGEVTALEWVYGPAGQRELRVRGYDLLHRLRKRQPVRTHVSVTLAELASDMVADIGLTVDAADPGPLWSRLLQHRHSDLQFLADLAARAGLYLTLRENVLHLLTLAGVGDPLPLTLGESLLEARMDVSSEPATRSVAVQSWNPREAVAHAGRARTPAIGRTPEASTAPDRVGGSGQRVLAGQAVQDDRHAEALAQAELDRYAAYEMTLWGVAAGDARLRPGARVVIDGIAGVAAGGFVLTEVTHTINAAQGFVSELSTVPPAPPADLAAPVAAVLGIVTQVNDPRAAGRVRASLPAYAAVETEWMQALSLGGGRSKGLMILPDVGDRVLVLLPNGDPGDGIILGGLYGPEAMPDSGVEGGATRRHTWLTAGGHRISLDDADETIRVEDSRGSYVELSPQKVLVHATTSLELEAPGQAVVIRGATIDFERA
jgi:phage baseplate assembly protein V